MILYGVLAMLCLIAAFGLAMYEHDLCWQIVKAVHSVRPDLEPFALFARTQSLWRGETLNLYRDHFPDGSLLRKRQIVSFGAPACFLLAAVFLVLAFRQS